MNFINFLLEKGIISQSQFESIISNLEKGEMTIEEAIDSAGLDKMTALKAKGEYMNVPTRSLAGVTIPYDILKYVPVESAPLRIYSNCY